MKTLTNEFYAENNNLEGVFTVVQRDIIGLGAKVVATFDYKNSGLTREQNQHEINAKIKMYGITEIY